MEFGSPQKCSIYENANWVDGLFLLMGQTAHAGELDSSLGRGRLSVYKLEQRERTPRAFGFFSFLPFVVLCLTAPISNSQLEAWNQNLKSPFEESHTIMYEPYRSRFTIYLHTRRRKLFDAGGGVAENSINGSLALEIFCNKRVRPVMTGLTVGSRFYNLRVEKNLIPRYLQANSSAVHWHQSPTSHQPLGSGVCCDTLAWHVKNIFNFTIIFIFYTY